LFATDEEYLENQTISFHISSDPDETRSTPRNPNTITFATPFPSHPVPTNVLTTSVSSSPFPRSISPTSPSTTGTATPRTSLLAMVGNTAPSSEPVVSHRSQLLNPFISSPKSSPYATPLAARVAAEVEENGLYDGIGSVVGGVDGRTGLDPAVDTGRRSSFALLQGIVSARGANGPGLAGSVTGKGKKLAGSFVGGTGIGIKGADGKAMEGLGLGGIAPENMSFSLRLALEEHMDMMGPSVRGR